MEKLDYIFCDIYSLHNKKIRPDKIRIQFYNYNFVQFKNCK